jgi:hypothetical protein
MNTVCHGIAQQQLDLSLLRRLKLVGKAILFHFRFYAQEKKSKRA